MRKLIDYKFDTREEMMEAIKQEINKTYLDRLKERE